MVITRAIMKLFKFFRETLELKSFSSNAKLNDDITQNNLLKQSENTANLLTPSVYNIKEKLFNASCHWIQWTEWSKCTLTCGTHSGSRQRIRYQNGSKFCSRQEETEFKSCPPVNKCPVDCVVGYWSEWTACSQSCGTGLKLRNRSIIKESTFGGAKCSVRASDYKEVSNCVVNNCPVDGEWSEWSRWSYCDTSCGEGKKSRKRGCDSPKPENGGRNCTGNINFFQI